MSRRIWDTERKVKFSFSNFSRKHEVIWGLLQITACFREKTSLFIRRKFPISSSNHYEGHDFLGKSPVAAVRSFLLTLQNWSCGSYLLSLSCLSALQMVLSLLGFIETITLWLKWFKPHHRQNFFHLYNKANNFISNKRNSFRQIFFGIFFAFTVKIKHA